MRTQTLSSLLFLLVALSCVSKVGIAKAQGIPDERARTIALSEPRTKQVLRELEAEAERHLEQGGWVVQDHRSMNIAAGLGVAVREFPLEKGFADYLLYVDGKAIGVIEAKPAGLGLWLMVTVLEGVVIALVNTVVTVTPGRPASHPSEGLVPHELAPAASAAALRARPGRADIVR